MKRAILLNILTFIFITLILLSCGNEPPVISSLLYNILIYQENSLKIPQDSIYLSVYFVLNDENGIEDIHEIKVTHIETEYSWIIPNDVLKKSIVWEEKGYTGYPFLEFNDGKSILTGGYLLEVSDSVGNVTEATFFVDVDGIISDEPYKVPQIKYNVELKNKNRELKITGDKYASCEVKILNKPELFKGGRKKFISGKNIVLSEEPLPENTIISVRINKEEDEKTVYFLKVLKVK